LIQTEFNFFLGFNSSFDLCTSIKKMSFIFIDNPFKNKPYTKVGLVKELTY